MKKFLLIFGVLAVFMVQIVLSYFIMNALFGSGPDPAIDGTEQVDGDGAGQGEEKSKGSGKAGEGGTFGATYTMQDLILNPRGASGRRIFKISLALAYDAANEKLTEELGSREPFIRDFLLEYLGNVPEDTLGDIRYRASLRDSLQLHINSFLAEGSVDRVLFLDFIRQ